MWSCSRSGVLHFDVKRLWGGGDEGDRRMIPVWSSGRRSLQVLVQAVFRSSMVLNTKYYFNLFDLRGDNIRLVINCTGRIFIICSFQSHANIIICVIKSRAGGNV